MQSQIRWHFRHFDQLPDFISRHDKTPNRICQQHHSATFICNGILMDDLKKYDILQIQRGVSNNMFWRLFHSFNILKDSHWITFGRCFFAIVFVSSAALVALGTIATVAKIAFDDRSWVTFIVLLVTIVQVGNMKLNPYKMIMLSFQPCRNLYLAWVYLTGNLKKKNYDCKH